MKTIQKFIICIEIMLLCLTRVISYNLPPHSISFTKSFSTKSILFSILSSKNIENDKNPKNVQIIHPESSNHKISKLRDILKQEGIDAFIIPSEDPHNSEYTALYYNRREYLTNFTGSAGIAIVLHDEAVLFTDGRYHNQASLELDDKVWKLMKQGMKGVVTPSEYLLHSLTSSSIIGIDPWVHNAHSIIKLIQSLHQKSIQLKLLAYNPIDKIWSSDERPSFPIEIIRKHEDIYSGLNITSKLTQIRQNIRNSHGNSLIITALDEIAWIYNLRGSDVPCNPVFLSYGFITQGLLV